MATRLILSFGIVQSFVFARVTCADDLLGAVRKDVRHLTGGLTVFPMALLIGLRLILLGLGLARILRRLLLLRLLSSHIAVLSLPVADPPQEQVHQYHRRTLRYKEHFQRDA